jgi:hypothetical protein
MGTRRLRVVKHPECLGQMAQRYCIYCSEMCPITALCVLMVMGEYLLQSLKEQHSQDSSEAHNSLPNPPEEQ